MDGNEIRTNVIEEKEEVHEKKGVKDYISEGWKKTKEGVGKAWHWTMDNKVNILVTMGMIKGGIALAKDAGLIKSKAEKLEDDRKLRVFDHKKGYFHYLRRPLTTQEKYELDRRTSAGESMVSVLDDFGVLRY